jgi:hypothetical protein
VKERSVAAGTISERPDVDSPAGDDDGARPGAPARLLARLPRRVRERSALALAVAVGAVARIVGLGWGLPQQLHADEWVVVRGALTMAVRHSFEPPYFFRPDHLEMQASNIAYLVYSGLIGARSVPSAYFADPAAFLLISRSITAAFGVGMILLAYAIGRRFTTGTGLVAAALVAVFPPFVEHSYYATPDVPLTFCLMIVVLGCMRYLESQARRDLLIACAGLALSVSVKYPGAIAGLMIAVVLVMEAIRTRDGKRLVRHAGVAAVAVPGFLFLISPVLFTDASSVMEAFASESRDNHLGADGLGWGGNLAFYATTFARAAGLLLVLAAAVGAYWCVRNRQRLAVPLLLGVVYWVVLSSVALHWQRWALPMYIAPLLLAAIGIRETWHHLRSARAPRWQLAVLGTAVGVAAVNLVTAVAAIAALHILPDTRLGAAADFRELGIDATNTVSEGYTPLVPGRSASIFGRVQVRDGELVILPGGNEARYVVVSSGMYDRYVAEERYSAERQVYRLLDETYPRVATYEPLPRDTTSSVEPVNIVRSVRYVVRAIGGGYGGPTLKVYEVVPVQG